MTRISTIHQTVKWLVFSLLFIESCSPDPLPPIIDEKPVFMAKGTLGAAPLDISAGFGNYYMDSRFDKDGLDILTFGGTFKKANCTACTEELTISIRDRKIMSAGANFVRDLSLRKGSYTIESMGQQFPIFWNHTYQFFSNILGPAANPDYQYLWIFNETDSSTASQPVMFFPEMNGQALKLTVTDPVQNCTDIWEGVVDVLDIQPTCPFTTFSYENAQDGTVLFTLPFFPDDIISSSWDFGDGSSVQMGNETGTPHTYAAPGTYDVCVNVVLQGGCADSFCGRVQSHRGKGCAAGFTYSPYILGSYFFQNASLEWVSADGKVYSSFATTAPQPSDSFFEITTIEPYLDDLDGQKTMKITAKAKATLFNKNNPADTLVLDLPELVFAVAYPD